MNVEVSQADVEALIGAETGVTTAVAARGPWAFVAMRGFAGPATDWRGVALADAPGGAGGSGGSDGVRAGDTFEVATTTSWRPRLRRGGGGGGGGGGSDGGVVVAERESGRDARILVPSAGGVTLGELLDETVQQRARIDASYAVHLLAALAPTLLVRVSEGGGGAISVDNVLLGFDGSVLARGDVPWWPARRPARLRAGLLTPTDGAESVRLFGELAAELFASKRFDARTGLSFPGHEGVVRREARDVVQWLLEKPVAPDVEDLWQEVDVPLIDEVTVRIDALRRLVDPVPPLALSTWVRHLFPERARREDAFSERIAALLRGP